MGNERTKREPNSFQQQSRLIKLKLITTTWPHELANKVNHQLIKYMPKVIFDHSKNTKLCINLAPCSSWIHHYLYTCTWSVFIAHVACLGKTSNSRHKYLGLFLRPKLQDYAQNFQLAQNFIFPNWKQIFGN